jgi:FlaA1/EpsC-like NDP-sugar epimerase
MRRQLRNPNLYLMIICDAIIFVLSLIGSYLARFDFILGQIEIRQLWVLFIWIVPLKLFIFFGFGLYRGMWRYTSVKDFWRLTQASLLSMLLVMAVILFIYRFEGFSRAIFILDGGFTFLMTGGLRMAIRSHFIRRERIQAGQIYTSQPRHRKKVLIIGAGNAGEKMLREIFDNYHLHYDVVGLIDDDSQKQGRSIHEVPVMGAVKDLRAIVKREDIEEVLIAIPSASGEQMRHIVDVCKGCNVYYKTLPGIGEIIDGRVSIKVLRDVKYEDLLGRAPVHLDITGIRNYIDGRTILITGCGGSIGSELCRQLVKYQPRSLILVDASETNLFHIQMELQQELYYHKFRCILGHIQDARLMRSVFQRFRPYVVFHAAAYKHVPILETNPWEAVTNNIQGSRVVMELAIEYGVDRFVLVSTDKAVKPTNVMGASKRVAELLLHAFQGNSTKFVAVRFGNVVGSSGSVIPLFRRQIEQGGPVTVTHPDVNRYFMTIPEAAQMILQAGAMGEGGEIFILRMGTPVKIADMARDLIRLSGKEPDTDIKIIYTGLREGEKLHEELITVGEDIVPTGHEKIMVLRSNGSSDGLKSPPVLREWLNAQLANLYDSAMLLDAQAIKRILQEIVPEYTPHDTETVLDK